MGEICSMILRDPGGIYWYRKSTGLKFLDGNLTWIQGLLPPPHNFDTNRKGVSPCMASLYHLPVRTFSTPLISCARLVVSARHSQENDLPVLYIMFKIPCDHSYNLHSGHSHWGFHVQILGFETSSTCF